MKYSRLILLVFAILLSSCAAKHQPIASIYNWSYPQKQLDKQFDFSYVDQVLEKSNNKRAAKWAKRKNIHVISIRLINNGKKPLHGMQLAIYNGDEPVEIMHNGWLAKKVRQRYSPLMILFIPAMLLEEALLHPHDDDDEYQSRAEQDYDYISMGIAEDVEKKREDANFNLKEELMDFQLANQILEPGKPIYGVIGIRCKGELNELRVVKNEVEFEILSTDH